MTSLQASPRFERQSSVQYDLFTSFYGDPKGLSNTIELWDAIPKYAVSARRQNDMRDANGRLPVHVAEFRYLLPGAMRASDCRVKINPAQIEVEDGVFKDFYPSQCEEIIEEVLKKFFTEQRHGFHSARNLESWVRFSLHMIRKELKARSHTRNLNEIKRALEVMSKSIVEVEILGGRKNLICTNPILTNMVRTNRVDMREDRSARWAAQLPALISKSVNELSYRQFNYALHMSFSSQLCRWLHKRLVHRYKQASLTVPYGFLYSSVRRDSGLMHNKRMSANVKALNDALEELKSEGILFIINAEKRYSGRQLKNVYYEVTASNEFIAEVKAASARLKSSAGSLV